MMENAVRLIDARDVEFDMTVTVAGVDHQLTMTIWANGTWRLTGERELRAAMGDKMFSAWLIHLWHGTSLPGPGAPVSWVLCPDDYDF